MDHFRGLDDDTKDFIIDLISKMATEENYKNPKVTYRLSKYKYGEIKPLPHRFFFFQFQNNIIFFAYVEKKKPELKDRFYKNLERKRVYYEEEFSKYLRGS